VHLAQASSLCGACKDACPVDIDLPKMLTRVRAGQSMSEGKRVEGAGLSLLTKIGLQMYTRLATRPRLFAASQKFAALGSSLFAPRSRWMRLPAFTGWGLSKDLPKFARSTFRDRFEIKKKDRSIIGQSIARSQDDALPVTNQPITNLLDQFTKELTALSGNVYETKDTTQDVIAFIKSRSVDRILLEENTLDELALRAAGIDFTYEPDPEFLIGVTNAICGLADTGSVLEADGALVPSLLPEIHIALLKTKDIFPSLSDAIHLVKDKRASVFITGPSRTADIEMTLTIGVHGPKEIHVFVA
jgi:L-lactate dehydrogenase complex protein LldG